MPVNFTELSFVGQLTLVLLLLLSMLSWGIIFDRYMKVKKAKSGFAPFVARISSVTSVNAFVGSNRQYDSPAGRAVNTVAHRAETEPDNEALERYAKIIGESELATMEKGMPILATIGSTSPFIGLFGTVWGIIEAFVGIGRYGSPNLAVVAPGIAEALVCTAAGLVVAVPAVVGYNFFVARVRDEARRIEQSLEIVLAVHRKWVNGGYR